MKCVSRRGNWMYRMLPESPQIFSRFPDKKWLLCAKNRELLIPEKESCEFWWGFHEKFPTVRVNRIFLCEIFFLCVWQVEALTNGYWSKIWSDRYLGIDESHAFTQFFTQILRRGISFYISVFMSICLHHIDLSRDSMTRT